MRSKPVISCALLCTLLLIPLTSRPSSANLIQVTSLADDGAGGCTLREAVEAANTNAAVGDCPAGNALAGDLIMFMVKGTVQLNSTIIITESLNIVGYPGPAPTTPLDELVIKGAPGSIIFLITSSEPNSIYWFQDIALVGPDSGSGQGIVMWTGDKVYLQRCLLKGFSSSYGAAIFNFHGEVLEISNSVFAGNSATGASAIGPNGGAIHSSGFLALHNCTLSGNYAEGKGGGVYATAGAKISHATFAGNRAGSAGGGIYLARSTEPQDIINSIFWGDDSPVAPEIGNMGSAVTVKYSDVAGASVWTGTGNILATPRFVRPRPAAAAPTTDGDYHLKHFSPCVDRGKNINGFDVDGDFHAQDRASDIGSDEAGPPFNDSFEYGAAGPLPWQGGNLSARDKRDTSVQHLGLASFKFTGGPVRKYLRQTLPIAGMKGNVITLSGWSKEGATALPAGSYSRMEARVFYNDGTTGRIDWRFDSGDHGWFIGGGTLTARRAFHKIVVYLWYEKRKGVAWFDDIKIRVQK